MPINNSSPTSLEPWESKDSNYLVNPGDRILANTSVGSWTLTLPGLPTLGQEIDLVGVTGLIDNPLTINLNGAKFQGTAPISIKLIKADYVKFIFVDDDIGWIAVNASCLETINKAQLLLDKYPNAGIACALYKLNSNYDGAAIKVKVSDSELDIGFDANGELDTNLANVDIVTWYDQSGKGHHFEQSNPNFRPRLAKFNNKYTLAFNNNAWLTTYLSMNQIVSANAETSIFTVFQKLPSPSAFLGNDFDSGPQSAFTLYPSWSNGITYFEVENMGAQGGQLSLNLTFNELSIAGFLRNKTITSIAKNGQLVSTGSNIGHFTNAQSNLFLGSAKNGSLAMQGYISSLIIYPEFLSNYQQLQFDLNNYYKIF